MSTDTSQPVHLTLDEATEVAIKMIVPVEHLSKAKQDELQLLLNDFREKKLGKSTEGKLMRFNQYDRYLIDTAAKLGGFQSCHHMMYEAIMTTTEVVLSQYFEGTNIQRAPSIDQITALVQRHGSHATDDLFDNEVDHVST